MDLFNKLQVLSTIYIRVFIFILTVIVVFASCIPYPGNIDEAEDSGYVLSVRNFSDVTYTGCTFYMGAVDDNNNFIALDSLVYNTIKIFNKNEGDSRTVNNVSLSITRPFDTFKEKLTKFGTWAPVSFKKVNEISSINKISIKFLLHENKISLTKIRNGIGTANFDILEDGTLR